MKMETTQVAVFTLGEYVCGIETDKLHTIIRYQQPETVEGAPEYFEGLTTWKDITIPLINLRAKFRIEGFQVTKKTKVLIVDIEGRLVGFTVDDIIMIQNCSADDIEAVPPVLAQYKTACLKAVCKSKDRLVPVLDFAKILTNSEINQFTTITH
jgi:purine-binding chemotaxis protein CheW